MSNPHQFWNPAAEGRDAYERDTYEEVKFGCHNPYDVGTLDFDAWAAGWLEAEADDASDAALRQ